MPFSAVPFCAGGDWAIGTLCGITTRDTDPGVREPIQLLYTSTMVFSAAETIIGCTIPAHVLIAPFLVQPSLKSLVPY